MSEPSNLLADLGIPSRTADVGAIGASDIDLTALLAPFPRRLYFGVGGLVYLKMTGDSAFSPYIVQAGQHLTGAWKTLGGSGQGTTITSGVIAEQ